MFLKQLIYAIVEHLYPIQDRVWQLYYWHFKHRKFDTQNRLYKVEQLLTKLYLCIYLYSNPTS